MGCVLMPELWTPSGGVNRKLKELYTPSGGVNRKLKELYAVSGGVNRKIFSGNTFKVTVSSIQMDNDDYSPVAAYNFTLNSDGSGNFHMFKSNAYYNNKCQVYATLNFAFDEVKSWNTGSSIITLNATTQYSGPKSSKSPFNGNYNGYLYAGGGLGLTQMLAFNTYSANQNFGLNATASASKNSLVIQFYFAIGSSSATTYGQVDMSWGSGDLAILGVPVENLEII